MSKPVFTSLHKYFCGVSAILKSAASSSWWYPLTIKANSALWICIFFVLDTALAKRATQSHFLKFHVSSDSFFKVGPHLCERRLFSEETEKFCVHVLVNQFCHSDAKFHLYRSVCSLKWWFPLSKTPFCKVGPMPLKNKRFLQSSLFSSKHSLLLQRQHFGDNKRFFKEQACKTNCRNNVRIKDQTSSFK